MICWEKKKKKGHEDKLPTFFFFLFLWGIKKPWERRKDWS